MKPNVSIIMLNWNNHEDTIACLKSLKQIDYSNYDIIIVDNGSSSDSVEEILKYINNDAAHILLNDSYVTSLQAVTFSRDEAVKGSHIEDALESIKSPKTVLIKNEKNYGFAGGNNIAADFALKFLRPDYVLLINNDVITEKHFLTELVNVAESEKKIGIVGPKIYFENYCGRSDVINFAGEDILLWKAKGIRHGYNKLDEGQYDKIKEVDKIDGACMLVKKIILESIGLFDPTFFAYWEETDLCIRVKKGGFKVIYVPTSRIWHKIASSTGGVYSDRRIYLITRNRFLFIKRNGLPIERFMFIIYFFSWDFWYTTAQFLKNRQFRTIPSFIRAILAGMNILLKDPALRKMNKNFISV
jgi:GT2 family glycosyltransferase